jgi:DNA-binding transcriptional ArsR family regulator
VKVASLRIVIPKITIDSQYLDALRKFDAQIFQALAHPTRVHIIETLVDGELSVGAILRRVKVEPTNLSQHLSVLRLKNMVVTRKVANQVFYSVRDPLIIDALDLMRRYFQRHFEEAIAVHKNIGKAR